MALTCPRCALCQTNPHISLASAGSKNYGIIRGCRSLIGPWHQLPTPAGYHATMPPLNIVALKIKIPNDEDSAVTASLILIRKQGSQQHEKGTRYKAIELTPSMISTARICSPASTTKLKATDRTPKMKPCNDSYNYKAKNEIANEKTNSHSNDERIKGSPYQAT